MMLLGYPNRFDLMSLSGGGFTTGLPRSYMLTRQLDQRARFFSALKRDTWFYAAGSSAVSMGVAALCGNNLSTDAQCRWRGFSVDPRGAVDGVFTTDTLPDGWSLSRSSSATYFDRNGLLQTAGTNTARFHWSGGVLLGLLMEPSRTNSLTYSRDLSNAAWTKTNVDASTTVTGIDGSANSARRLSATAGNGTVTQAVSAGTQGVFSAYMRRVSGSGNVQFSLDNFSTTTNLTITTSWARVYIAGTVSGAGVVGVRIVTSGDVIEVDCFQFESTTSTLPTTPIITTVSVATRNAESLAYSTATLSFSGGALLFDAYLLAPPTSTLPIVHVDDGTVNNSAGFDMTSAGAFTASAYSGGAQQVSGVAGSAVSVNSAFSGAISWAANDVHAAFDGGSASTDSSVTVPAGSPARIYVTGNASMCVRRVKAYAATRTTAQVQALSGTEKEVAADFDTGWFDAWPADYISGATSEMIAAAATPALHKPAAAQSYQYWRLDVDDESNADGYVEIGRPFMGAAWQPTYNASYGAGVGFVDLSSSVRAYGGARYFEDTRNPRSFAFSFDALSDSEAWTKAYELLAQQGSTKEVLFSWSPADLSNLPRHTFLCTVTALDGLTAAAYGFWSKAYRVEELL